MASPVPQVTRKEFKFAAKHNLPFFFVSAADGTNIVKVLRALPTCRTTAVDAKIELRAVFRSFLGQVFQSAILEARRFKAGGGDALSEMFDLLAESVRRQCSCFFIADLTPSLSYHRKYPWSDRRGGRGLETGGVFCQLFLFVVNWSVDECVSQCFFKI